MAEHMVCNHGVRGSNPLTSIMTLRIAESPDCGFNSRRVVDVTKLAPRAILDAVLMSNV